MMETIDSLIRQEPSRILVPAAAAVLGLLLYGIANSLLKRGVRAVRLSLESGRSFSFERLYTPARLLFALLLLLSLQHLFSLPESLSGTVSHLVSVGIIVVSAWLAMRIIAETGSMFIGKSELEKSDNLEARKLATHLDLTRKVLNVLIVVIAAAGVLMTFDTVRQVGVSLLASAGVAGIILGFAAQKSIAMLLAGIQIAVTQPIRIDDVVIVENTWGRIEEITLTYVVVRIWDDRRLIVPVNHFIETPFENWTRTSAGLIGSVRFYTDYSVDIDALRRELERIVAASPLWDKRVVNLQVTDASEKCLELRALVSAADSSDSWDLRCHVRESLLRFLRENHPGALPKIRVRKTGGDE